MRLELPIHLSSSMTCWYVTLLSLSFSACLYRVYLIVQAPSRHQLSWASRTGENWPYIVATAVAVSLAQTWLTRTGDAMRAVKCSSFWGQKSLSSSHHCCNDPVLVVQFLRTVLSAIHFCEQLQVSALVHVDFVRTVFSQELAGIYDQDPLHCQLDVACSYAKLVADFERKSEDLVKLQEWFCHFAARKRTKHPLAAELQSDNTSLTHQKDND